MSEIWQMPAREMASRIRAGELSSVEIVAQVLDRIERLGPHVNAFAHVDAKGALEAAEAADRALRGGQASGALHGIPVTVKDLVATRGMPTAFGSHAFAGNRPETDAVAVARLRAAGAIVIGKTTTPELGHKVLTDSPAYGPTRNPWALDKSPGGSSGGAAAAVAMGFGPLAVSTDGAGSGRIPAACCGLVGLKPTIGAVPHETHSDLFGPLTCVGAMARGVDDAALLFDVMRGPDPRDPWSLAGSSDPLIMPSDRLAVLRGLRVRFVGHMGSDFLDPEVDRLVRRTLRQMEDEGAHLAEVRPRHDWGLDAALTLIRAYQAARFGHLLEHWRDKMDPALVQGLEYGLSLDGRQLAEAIAARTRLFRDVQEHFQAADVLVTPTVALPALDIDQRSDAPLVVAGRTIGPLRENWYSYTIPFNPSGNPAVSVPCGFTSAGLPVGLQIVGPWHSEARLLSVAAAIEALSPWQDKWPPLALEGLSY